jgi:type IV pilus assembly protein PilB
VPASHLRFKLPTINRSAPIAAYSEIVGPRFILTSAQTAGSNRRVSAALPRKRKLGELLVNEGLLTPERLAEALQEQERSGDRLGRVVQRAFAIAEEEIIQVLSRQLGIPVIDLSTVLIDPQVLRLVPERLARLHQAVPVYVENGELVVAMTDPLNVVGLDDIARASRLAVRPAVAKEAQIAAAIEQYQGGGGSVQEVLQTISVEKLGFIPDEGGSRERLEKVAAEAPVVRLVNTILVQAVADRASDVHLIPESETLVLRLRIDGVLHTVATFPKVLHPAILSRLKIMAGMDIAEKRQPQDGRCQLQVGNQEVDVRAATLPTIHGEKIALRLLDRNAALLDLAALGMAPEELNAVRGFAAKPHGLILATGPTGSGKTTTLYALLQTLDAVHRNIITFEDPVEYHLPNVTQIQVNRKAGMTFAHGLRAILRQDPDIVMVGEIRDRETSEIAIHAALTGHLVLSTLHTNDCVGAVTRLLDMGVEPYLAASALEGVLSQRLVRTICPSCRTATTPDPDVLAGFGLPPGTALASGSGCPACKQTGYLGRTGIFEALVPREELRRAIIRKSAAETVRDLARSAGLRTLRETGLEKVRSGVTTIEEILRVSLPIED